jgi:hypothetical protein
VTFKPSRSKVLGDHDALLRAGGAVMSPGGAGFVPPAAGGFSYATDFSANDGGWAGAGFSVSGGNALIAPTLSAEKLADPGVETWATPTDLTSWSESIAGTSTINEESVQFHGGAKSARLDVDGTNSTCQIFQTLGGQVSGAWVVLGGWMRSSASGKTGSYQGSSLGFIDAFAHDPGTSFAEFVANGITTGTTWQPFFSKLSASSASLYWDDLTLKEITLSTMFATRATGVNNVRVSGNWTIPQPRTVAGIVACLDNTGSPANFLIAYHNSRPGASTGSIRLDKYVGGARTNLISTNMTYVANAPVEIRKNGTTVQLFYNGAQVGTDQTVSDAGIIGNTIHGLFNAYSGNTCDSFAMQAA